MKKLIFVLFMCLSCAGQAMADDLDIFLDDLDNQAREDRVGYVDSIGHHFGIPAREVEDVLRSSRRPSDAFMIFELGRSLGLDRDRVMRTYEGGKGKGWGAMAQEMGIKPGSKEFHALKRGDFNYSRSNYRKGGRDYGDDRYDDRKRKGYDDDRYDDRKDKGYDDDDRGQGGGKGKGKNDDSPGGKGGGKGKKGADDELIPGSQGGGQGGGKGKKQ